MVPLAVLAAFRPWLAVHVALGVEDVEADVGGEEMVSDPEGKLYLGHAQPHQHQFVVLVVVFVTIVDVCIIWNGNIGCCRMSIGTGKGGYFHRDRAAIARVALSLRSRPWPQPVTECVYQYRPSCNTIAAVILTIAAVILLLRPILIKTMRIAILTGKTLISQFILTHSRQGIQIRLRGGRRSPVPDDVPSIPVPSSRHRRRPRRHQRGRLPRATHHPQGESSARMRTTTTTSTTSQREEGGSRGSRRGRNGRWEGKRGGLLAGHRWRLAGSKTIGRHFGMFPVTAIAARIETVATWTAE
mmetsp:Transcript_9940/g.18536  ORF Transcript_9940/g.18536 Transcript_9940/m.18536 type:complete len:300 (-) Transcript_9940:252-1151(-)